MACVVSTALCVCVCVSVAAYLHIKVQSANIDEDAGPKVEKGDPLRLVQGDCPFKASKGDGASFILQYLSDNLDIYLLVHRGIVARAEVLSMNGCGCLPKSMTLGNSLGKDL